VTRSIESGDGDEAIRVNVEGRVHVLRAGQEWTIGRDRSADIRLRTELVSRQHAVLRRDRQGWELADLDSRNGVWLDGRRIRTLRVPPGGARVQVGGAEGPVMDLAPAGGAGAGEPSRSVPRADLIVARHPVPLGTFRIGREGTNDIVLSDLLVSRRHAQLSVTPDGVTVQDCGSSNGTYLNGRRIEQSRVRAGDRPASTAV
jgi:pSer/pThr/pTyr-binding forkhead associated (FHA) protein